MQRCLSSGSACYDILGSGERSLRGPLLDIRTTLHTILHYTVVRVQNTGFGDLGHISQHSGRETPIASKRVQYDLALLGGHCAYSLLRQVSVKDTGIYAVGFQNRLNVYDLIVLNSQLNPT